MDVEAIIGETARLRRSGSHRAAEETLRAALTPNPADPRLHAELGLVLREAGRPGEAAAALARAVELDGPRAGSGLYANLARALLDDGQAAAAVTAARTATTLAPEDRAVLGVLAAACLADGDEAQAEAAWRRALAGNAADTAALAGLGGMLREQGRAEEARALYRRLAEVVPRAVGARVRAVTVLPVIARSRDDIARWRGDLESGLDVLETEGIRLADPFAEVGTTNFFLAYHGLDDRPLQERIARFHLAACPDLGWTAPHCRNRRTAGRKIRLAVVSPFMNNPHHTMSKLFAGVLEHMDRNLFEVLLLRGPVVSGDDPGRAADRAIDLPRDLAAARERIAGLEPDILFYTDIGMDPLTYFLAFARLAPVQCATWGHPVTSGIPNVDFFLSSDHLEPADGASHYSERLVRFRDPQPFYRRPDDPGDGWTRERFGLPAGGTLYVCPQTLFRLHPDFDAVLADLLARDPSGRLVLVAGKKTRWNDLLRTRWRKALGEAAGRVHFLPPMGREAFLGLLKLGDVLLDPLYFGGGNTSYEAFGLGRPVITWRDAPFMRGRITHALYRHMGADGLEAGDAAGFVDLALRLGRDRDWRDSCRAEIGERSNSLFENRAVIGEYEDFFESVVRSPS